MSKHANQTSNGPLNMVSLPVLNIILDKSLEAGVNTYKTWVSQSSTEESECEIWSLVPSWLHPAREVSPAPAHDLHHCAGSLLTISVHTPDNVAFCHIWRQVLALQSMLQKGNSCKTRTCLEGKAVRFKKETAGRVLGICRVV